MHLLLMTDDQTLDGSAEKPDHIEVLSDKRLTLNLSIWVSTHHKLPLSARKTVFAVREC